jgi:hypothetical protein
MATRFRGTRAAASGNFAVEADEEHGKHGRFAYVWVPDVNAKQQLSPGYYRRVDALNELEFNMAWERYSRNAAAQQAKADALDVLATEHGYTIGVPEKEDGEDGAVTV